MLHSPTMWLIVSSQSPHNLHLLFYWSIVFGLWYNWSLRCGFYAMRRVSVSRLVFRLFIVWSANTGVFSSHFCFRVIFCFCWSSCCLYYFSLWYDWSFWRCPVLLLREIPFLSKGFLFLARSRFSGVWCCLLVIQSRHRVVFSPIFIF